MTDWRQNLDTFFEKTEKRASESKEHELSRFINGIVVPAFEQIRDQLEKHGREINIRSSEVSAAMMIYRSGEEEMTYRIQTRTFPSGVVPYAEVRFRQRGGTKLVRSETPFRVGTPPKYTIADVTADEIIQNFISHYTSRVKTD
jgi:hypothetical protein